MSKPGLSFGLSLGKKPAKPGPKAPAKSMFGGDDSDSGPEDGAPAPQAAAPAKKPKKGLNSSSKGAPPPAPPPSLKSKKAGGGGGANPSAYGDLSSALDSQRHMQAAEELDPSVYDYDGVYDSLKQPEREKQAAAAADSAERRPKYMKSLLASAAVRKRDALIAEEKKIARDREAEGDEFADKDKFVTEAYRRQQEENRRVEEEEREREEREAAGNKGGGMAAFYKDLLERGDQRHAQAVKAVEDKAKANAGSQEQRQGQGGEGGGGGGGEVGEEGEEGGERTQTDRAREINAQGGSIAINQDGEVVDKRELLRGGLNLGERKKQEPKKSAADDDGGRGPGRYSSGSSSRGGGPAGAGGGKQAMRQRQTRMVEAQLEQALKRNLEVEQEERERVERASKSRKTESDISSAKERYLARKRAAEEEKKRATTEGGGDAGA